MGLPGELYIGGVALARGYFERSKATAEKFIRDPFSDEPQAARTIAARYVDYPVDRWRNAFLTLLNQLDEADGKNPKVADAEDRGQRQGQLAATEPSFDFTLDARRINLAWQHVEQVRIDYYLMDVELLFSRNPFVQEVSGPFASIRPNATKIHLLDAQRYQSGFLTRRIENRVRV